MIVYVDTSAVLRVLLREGRPVDVWAKWRKGYSSSLWRVEAMRTVDRLRLAGALSDSELADLTREVQVVHETLTIVPVSEGILQRAGETFPTAVGTSDAIHLATALAVSTVEEMDFLLTHDVQMGTAARSLGFTVAGVD